MNIFEQVSHRLGRTRGQFLKGLESVFSTSGSSASVYDDSAYLDWEIWGSALLEGKKPRTKKQFIEAFQSWVYICVKLNAQTVASQRLRLYVAKKAKGQKFKTIETRSVERERLKYIYSNTYLDHWLTKAAEVDEVTEHPFLELMKQVNPHHNQRDLKEFTTMYSDLTGECYWLMIKDKLQTPSQIWTIPSQYINPKFGDSLDKAIEYFVYKRGSIEVKIPVENIVYFTYPNPKNIFTGFSCIQGVADAIYIRGEMDAFETALFENRARPGSVFTVEGSISEKERERLEHKIDQKYSRSKNAGRNLLLTGGMKYTRDTMTPTELNFVDGRRLNMEEICLSLDIPPGSLTSTNVNLANAKVADGRHAKNGIKPRCERFAEKLNEKVLPLYDDKIFCAFDNPVPQDRMLVLREQTEGVNAGFITLNEVREEKGLEPVEGGDEPLIDSRKVPLSRLMQEPEPTEPTEEEEEEFIRRVKGKVKEMVG